jgi:hypothetical protein
VVSLAEPVRRRGPFLYRLEGEQMNAKDEKFPSREFNDEEKSALATILTILNQETMVEILHDGLLREGDS